MEGVTITALQLVHYSDLNSTLEQIFEVRGGNEVCIFFNRNLFSR